MGTNFLATDETQIEHGFFCEENFAAFVGSVSIVITAETLYLTHSYVQNNIYI